MNNSIVGNQLKQCSFLEFTPCAELVKLSLSEASSCFLYYNQYDIIYLYL